MTVRPEMTHMQNCILDHIYDCNIVSLEEIKRLCDPFITPHDVDMILMILTRGGLIKEIKHNGKTSYEKTL